MLINSESGKPFEPDPSYFIVGFDIYDREETLGDKLNKYDLDNHEHIKILAKMAVLDSSGIRKQSYKHVWLLVHVLEEAVNDPNYDFSFVLQGSGDEYFCLPSQWNKKNPRPLFEEILKVAKEEWKDDLEKANKEDPSTW